MTLTGAFVATVESVQSLVSALSDHVNLLASNGQAGLVNKLRVTSLRRMPTSSRMAPLEWSLGYAPSSDRARFLRVAEKGSSSSALVSRADVWHDPRTEGRGNEQRLRP